MTRSTLALVAVALLGAALWALAPAATRAQNATPPTLSALLLEQTQRNPRPLTVEFVTTVPRLGKSVDVGAGEPLQIGAALADAVCFRAPGESITQVTCVPLANISAVFYAE